MMIANISVFSDHELLVETSEGKSGVFNIEPYLTLEAFEPLLDPSNFKEVRNGGYFIEWQCGADLSADTVEAHLEFRSP
jgi:hypothetical protein